MIALVVGLGSIGRRHARNWAELGLGEVWVCRQTMASALGTFDVPVRTYSDLDEALAARPDVVLVTNPTSLHVATALAALRTGCHVFVEKPLGASTDGVSALLEEAKRQERRLLVGYNLRFHPLLARLRELLDAGAIGRPVSARAEVGEYLPDWHPWEDYRQGYAARSALGGGPILTLSHELDSLCWVMGRPTRLTALAAHASGLEVDTDDVAEIVLRFESGAIGSVHVDYVRRPPRRSLEVVGEDGVLRWEYEEDRLLVYAPATREWRIEQGSPTYTRNQMFLDELRELAGCLAGQPPERLASGEQGAAVLLLAVLAARSSTEGRAFDLTDDQIGEAATWLTSLARTRPPSRRPSTSSSASTGG